MRQIAAFVTFLVLLLSVSVKSFVWGQEEEKMAVLVTLPPFAYFVDAVGGEWVECTPISPQGANPHLYEPTPGQVERIAKAALWFRMGLSFEHKILQRVQSLPHPPMIVDLRQNLPLLSGGCACCSGEHSGEDPHFWLSPRIAQSFTRTITDSLMLLLPDHAGKIEQRGAHLCQELAALDAELQAQLAPFAGNTLLTSHRALAYFCADYGLHQLAIEIEGKEPSPRQLQKLFKEASAAKCSLLIAQVQHQTKAARRMARELAIPIYSFDPLSPDYPTTLRKLAYLVEPTDTP